MAAEYSDRLLAQGILFTAAKPAGEAQSVAPRGQHRMLAPLGQKRHHSPAQGFDIAVPPVVGKYPEQPPSQDCHCSLR